MLLHYAAVFSFCTSEKQTDWLSVWTVSHKYIFLGFIPLRVRWTCKQLHYISENNTEQNLTRAHIALLHWQVAFFLNDCIIIKNIKSCCILGHTFALEFFFLDAGLLAPVLFLKPVFASPKTRCCSSSDILYRCTANKPHIRNTSSKNKTCKQCLRLTLRNLFISISYSFFLWKKKKTKKSDNLDKLALFIDFFLSVIHDSQVTCSQRFW